jgi:hypothetical protein
MQYLREVDCQYVSNDDKSEHLSDEADLDYYNHLLEETATGLHKSRGGLQGGA